MSTMDDTPVAPADDADGMPPFPDHPVGDVATIIGACAALVQGDSGLRDSAIEALTADDQDRGEWAATVADSLAYVLRMCGADADVLWTAFYALSSEHAEATTAPAPAPAVV